MLILAFFYRMNYPFSPPKSNVPLVSVIHSYKHFCGTSLGHVTKGKLFLTCDHVSRIQLQRSHRFAPWAFFCRFPRSICPIWSSPPWPPKSLYFWVCDLVAFFLGVGGKVVLMKRDKSWSVQSVSCNNLLLLRIDCWSQKALRQPDLSWWDAHDLHGMQCSYRLQLEFKWCNRETSPNCFMNLGILIHKDVRMNRILEFACNAWKR